MDNVKLEFEEKGGKPGVKIKKHRLNTTKAYIVRLLREGFRGNIYYYRDDDRRLTLKVWEHEGLKLTPEQQRKFLHDVTFPDTITRARREMRSEYPDSPAVQEKRFRLFVDKKDEYGKGGRLRRIVKR